MKTARLTALLLTTASFTFAACYFYFETSISKTVVLKMNQDVRKPSNTELLNALQGHLPYKDKLDEYFRILGVSKHGIGYQGMNSGHVEYFSNLADSSECFTSLAFEYYRLIKLYDQKVGIYSRTDDNSLLKSRPVIDDEAGQGSRQHVNPGYAWDLALRMSQGDRYLALNLVGACGHDDENRSVRTGLCPDRTSSLYVPGSLGKSVNIDKGLIDRIVKTQAPNLGSKAIPAKYYHVIAAAITSCAAIKNDVPAWLVKWGQVIAVRTYRSKRLCSKFSELISDSPSFEVGSISDENIKTIKNLLANTIPSEKEKLIRDFFFK